MISETLQLQVWLKAHIKSRLHAVEEGFEAIFKDCKNIPQLNAAKQLHVFK